MEDLCYKFSQLKENLRSVQNHLKLEEYIKAESEQQKNTLQNA